MRLTPQIVLRKCLLPACNLIAILVGLAATPRLHGADGAIVPGRPLTLTVCGGETFGPGMANIDARLAALRQIGVTSIQTYVYWNKVEKSPGVLDWSAYDEEVKLYQKHGLKWVPFIVTGPWYLTPEHVRRDPDITMYKCLEHGRDSLIPSLWSPRFRELVRTYLTRFAEHYRPMGVLESVNLGITGDYGEAIYSVIGNWPGSYHSHAGFWCGDAMAVADFRRHARALYPDGIAALNAAWHTHYASFDEIAMLPPAKAPSERAWQEFLAWYRGAMTQYADYCVALARELFPSEDIYLCTGGDMAPEHGSDFFAQARIAAAHHAGIRITNEASSYPMNVRYTRMVASGCRHYGAYFGHEPAAVVTPEGTLGRIYNAVTAGANQLFLYYGSEVVADTQPPSPGPSGRYLQQYRPIMNQVVPVIDAAVYHPNPSSQQVLSGEVSRVASQNFGELLGEIRRFIDYDLVDDRLIQEGALDHKSILIVSGALVMDAATTARITRWVEQGGIVFTLASRPTDWEGSTAAFDRLLGLTPATDEAEGIAQDGPLYPRPELLPSITGLSEVTLTRAFTALAPDCEVLMAMRYLPTAGVAWQRQVGRGRVYVFFGPMAMKPDEASWMISHRLPLRFMRDCLAACVNENRLTRVPLSVNLDIPDFYKVETTDGLWLLNLGTEARTVATGVQSVTVPPRAIIHQPLPATTR
jgi:hypothetical protein